MSPMPNKKQNWPSHRNVEAYLKSSNTEMNISGTGIEVHRNNSVDARKWLGEEKGLPAFQAEIEIPCLWKTSFRTLELNLKGKLKKLPERRAFLVKERQWTLITCSRRQSLIWRALSPTGEQSSL